MTRYPRHPQSEHVPAVIDVDQVGLVGCEARDAALRHQGELLQDVALTNLGQAVSGGVVTGPTHLGAVQSLVYSASKGFFTQKHGEFVQPDLRHHRTVG